MQGEAKRTELPTVVKIGKHGYSIHQRSVECTFDSDLGTGGSGAWPPPLKVGYSMVQEALCL